MVFVNIPDADTKVGEPLDELLMTTIDKDLEDLDARIDKIGGGPIVVGGDLTSITTLGDYGYRYYDEIISGGKDNSPKMSRTKWRPKPHDISGDARNDNFMDETNKDDGKRRFYVFPEDSYLGYSTDATAQFGQYCTVNNGTSVFLEIKRGENWFAIESYGGAGNTTSLQIFIDSQTPSSLGLVDENGNASADSVNLSLVGTIFGVKYIAFGLDGEPHTLEIKNNSAGACYLTSIEFGTFNDDYTVTNKVKVSGGTTASGKTFDGAEFTFDNDIASGYLGSVVLKADGTTYSLKGEGVVTGLVKTGTTINFPARPTTLPMQGLANFPDSGICFLTIGNGNNYFFSYAGREQTDINICAFTGIVWETVYHKAYIVDDVPATLNTLVVKCTTNSIVNYIGTAPIIISATNNKLDFSVKINGAIAQHTITIPIGAYSADLVNIGVIIENLINSALSIKEGCYVYYNQGTQLWNILINNISVTEFSLLFGSGPNSASSVAVTLGFVLSDYTGKLNYSGETPLPQLSCKSFVRGDLIDYTSTKIKFSSASSGSAYTNPELAKNTAFTGWYMACSSLDNSADTAYWSYTPPEDCVGVDLVFIGDNNTGTFVVQIDEHSFYTLNTSYPATLANQIDKVFGYTITFPKFTKCVRIVGIRSGLGPIAGETFRFQYLKELYLKPAFEKLQLGEKIIKTFNISPSDFYSHTCAYFNGPYVPQGASDPIKAYSEVGGFATDNKTTNLFYYSRWNNVANSEINVDFEIKKDGGGICFYHPGGHAVASGSATIVKVYLTNGATINTATDLFSFYCPWSHSTAFTFVKSMTGLKAGLYKVRLVKDPTTLAGNRWWLMGIGIIDQKLNTAEQVENVPLNQYSIPVPLYCARAYFMKDDEVNVTESEQRVGTSIRKYDSNFALTMQSNSNFGWNGYFAPKTAGTYLRKGTERVSVRAYQTPMTQKMLGIGREFCFTEEHHSGLSASNTYGLNGVPIYTYSSVQPFCKFTLSVAIDWFQLVKRKTSTVTSCVFSAGQTYTVTSTKGFVPGRFVELFDGTNYEQLKVASIVTNTSFTTNTSSVVVNANVISADTKGFHSMYITNNSAVTVGLASFEVLPLTINSSDYYLKFGDKEPEQSIAVYKGIGSTGSISYPVFKDGQRGGFKNTVYQVTAQSAAAVFYSINLGDSISVSVTGGTIDLLLTSIR